MKTLKLLFLISIVSIGCYGQMFTEVEDNPFGDDPISIGYSQIVLGDINNDNKQDIILSGYYQDTSKIYENLGFMMFESQVNILLGGIDSPRIGIADVNGDGLNDILIGGYYTADSIYTAKLYVNDGFGQLIEVEDTPFEWGSNSTITIADIDNDGDSDIVISGIPIGFSYANANTKLYKNIDGAFYDFATMQGGDGSWNGFGVIYVLSLTFADVDNDNDLDVFITKIATTGWSGGNSHSVSLYFNEGHGEFVAANIASFNGSNYRHVALADIDGDGDQDLLATGYYSSYWESLLFTRIYSNDGAGNFTPIENIPFENTSSKPTYFVDVDNDGDPDVLISEGDSGYDLKLYLNSGGGKFEEDTDTPFDFGSRVVGVADFDGDQDQDLLTYSGSNGMLSLYRNNTVLFGPDYTRFTTLGMMASPSGNRLDSQDFFSAGSGGDNSNTISTTVVLPSANVFGNVSVYPNPSQGQVNIKLDDLEDVTINVYNALGVQIYHKENINSPLHNFTFEGNPGLYLIELITDNQKQHFKIIKQD